MKKITTFILAMAALSSIWNANGQTVGDALRFSDQNYYGTARSIAMGNAFTALGGDLGSVNINPAGSAVNSFSQVTITPGVSISGSRAQYLGEPSINDKYGPAYKNSSARLTMPNVGVMIVLFCSYTNSSSVICSSALCPNSSTVTISPRL